MSDPIDFIDLTVDSPVEKYVKLRKKNAENIANNTKPKSHKSSKCQSAQHYDSVIEISFDDTWKDVEAMEIIDLDSIALPEQNKICNINNSTQRSTLTCPICLEQLTSEMKPMSTRCGHIFCEQCIQKALSIAKKCPTCKKNMKFQTCNRLYF